MEIALIIGRILLMYGPAAAQAWQKIFSNPSPTAEDWAKVWAVPHKSYDDYVLGQKPDPAP